MSTAIVSTQLNGFNYGNLTQIFLFDINHLFANTKVVSKYCNLKLILFNTIHSFAQLNGSKYCYIDNEICLYNHMVKEFYF